MLEALFLHVERYFHVKDYIKQPDDKPGKGRVVELKPPAGWLTLIRGYGLRFQDAVEAGIDVVGSVAIVCVDNNPTRIAASCFYRRHGIPMIFTAVSREADHGYVFIQEAGKACFGCLAAGG